MNVGKRCDTPDLQRIETVDLDTEVESDPELTQTEHVTAKAKPDSKPEEEITLTALAPVDPNSLTTPNAAHQSSSNLGLKMLKKCVDVIVKGGSNNEEKLIPLKVKSGSGKSTIMITEAQMTTLMKKQKAGVPITLAVSKTQTLDPHIKNPKPLLVSKPVNVCTVSPQNVKMLQSAYTTVPAVQTVTSTQVLPINSHPSPLNSPNSTITSLNSTTTTLNNAMSSNLGIPAGTQIASFTTVGDVMKWNPVSALPASENAAVTSLNNAVQNNMVGLSHKVVAPSLPSNTPRTPNINVLRQNPSICCPTKTAVKTILPRTVTIPRGISKDFVVYPTSVGSSTTPNTGSISNSPRNSAPHQPRFLLTKINSALNKKSVHYQLKLISSPSGGNLMGTKASQNGTSANQSLPDNADASKTNESSKTVVRRPVIQGRLVMPKQTREVLLPRVQPDGSVRLEKRIIPWDKKADESCKHQSQFTLSEVSNNPSESGVAKKFVVAPTNHVPVCPSPLLQNTIQSTTSTTVNTAKTVQSTTSTNVNTALVVNARLPSTPLWLLNNRPGGKHGPSSHKSMLQWHHPYTGDSPNAVDAPEVAGESITENDPVRISDDDDDDARPTTEASSPPSLIAGFPGTNNCTVCISDDDERLDPTRSSRPPLANTEKHSVMSIQLSSNAEEHSTRNYLFCPRIESGSVHSIAQFEVIDELNSKSNSSNSCKSKFQWHQPCADAEARSPRDNSALIENSGPRIQSEAPPVKFHIKPGRHWSKTLFTPSSKKKKKKNKKKTGKDEKRKIKKKKKKRKKALLNKYSPDVMDSQTDIRKKFSSSSRPTSPPGDMNPFRASSPNLEGNSFQWHHPSTDTNPEKAAEKSEVVRYSGLKTEPVSLLGFNGQQAQGPSLPGYGQEPGNTEDTSEPKYLPRSDAEASVNNEQDSPRIEIGSVHSVTSSKCVAISSAFSEEIQKRSSCSTQDEFSSSLVADDKEETIPTENSPASTGSSGLTVLPKGRNDSFILGKMQLNLKRRLKAKAGGWSTGCPTVSRPLRRVLVGGQDEPPQKFRKKIQSSGTATQSSQHIEQIGKGSKLSNGHTTQKESSGADSNILRDCIMRKTIQDCYLEGVIPTIDKIHDACCGSGLELPKTSVEPHLISIGYNWVKCKSQRLLLEDHRFTAERIKYLNKLKKYQGKNLVYIFVSEFVKKNGTVWQVSPSDVKRPSRDAARVVLHAVSDNYLLEGGLEMVNIGLFGLRRNDIISWLNCSVIPNIPQGSVVIFGHHPVFDKNEETEERPNIAYSKEEIVSWLTSHKVTSVNPDLPKALLLCKVNNVILPKTSMFDKLIRQNGFVPLHLPKHHMDLNPVAFIWQDILEKLYKTPEIISVDDLQDFVTREFSSVSRILSSVACNLVRKFGCSYREFDSCSDELFEKLLSDTCSLTDAAQVVEAAAVVTRRTNRSSSNLLSNTSSVTDAAQVVEAAAVVTKRTTRSSGKLPLSKCPICLGTKRFKGYRCSACKNFWYKLTHNYKFRRQTGATLPVCEDMNHVVARPPDCLGCRRHRYELALFNQVNIMKKRPQYVLPIPPVTEMGKKHWSIKSKKRSKKSSNLSRREPQEDGEEN